MRRLAALRNNTRQAYRSLERRYTAAFAAANPWKHLGPLGIFFLCLVVVSGIYLYVQIDTSVQGVYRSIVDLSRDPRSLGGLMHSLHRYSADAFLLLTTLHLLREFLLGRFRHFYRFAWLTGVPLLAFVMISGIGGFWLKWDQLGQFSAQATAEWLDALGLFATATARNFLVDSAVADRMFSLFVFVHIGVPLLLVFGLWFHLQRIVRAEIWPPRALALGSGATLLVLALLMPVGSEVAADLSRVPMTLRFDWFFLWPNALLYTASAVGLWVLTAASFLFLLLLPFLPRASRHV